MIAPAAAHLPAFSNRSSSRLWPADSRVEWACNCAHSQPAHSRGRPLPDSSAAHSLFIIIVRLWRRRQAGWALRREIDRIEWAGAAAATRRNWWRPQLDKRVGRANQAPDNDLVLSGHRLCAGPQGRSKSRSCRSQAGRLAEARFGWRPTKPAR
jgi:hypothetical protein